jgi:CHAT domain-containing protein
MREVLYKPFTSNLVVISGCETTLGKEINGEGFNSLSRGLLSQGVGSVIGTIWSISDRATPEFMQAFYTHLKQQQGNVSLALKLTKQSFVTDSKLRRYRHPYYWAGFVLTSSNQSISESIF